MLTLKEYIKLHKHLEEVSDNSPRLYVYYHILNEEDYIEIILN